MATRSSQIYNSEVYKAWTPVYKGAQRGATASAAAADGESGVWFQSGLKQQVVEREAELNREAEPTPSVRECSVSICLSPHLTALMYI